MGAFSRAIAIWVAERGFQETRPRRRAIFIGGSARGINACGGRYSVCQRRRRAVIGSMLGSDVMMIAALNNKGVHRLLCGRISIRGGLKSKASPLPPSAPHRIVLLLLNH
jgi:hypothetical protein